MRVSASAGRSDPGRVRRRNEDAFVCDPPLFAVADGMGGAQAGELASRIAAAAFRELQRSSELDPETRLRQVIQEANRRIYARASRDPGASGMGTTVTAALVTGDHVALGHVGDSRAYRLRGRVLERLTEDHSLVADLVRSGRISQEEAELHPQRSVITRALGTDPAVVVDSALVDAQPGDVFLLCSDGLTTMVDERTTAEIIAGADDLTAAARALVAAANREGGGDNVTVVLFALAEGEPDTADDEDTLTGLTLPAGDVARSAPAGAEGHGLAGTPSVPAARSPVAVARRERRREGASVRRGVLIAAAVLALFAGLAALALFGLSRAHFVGADRDGRITVYQGVPWHIFGGVELYREVYVSRLLAVQLTPEERAELFDHSLVSEDEARERIALFEQEATPGTAP